MKRIALLSALAEHADQSRELLLKTLADAARTSDSESDLVTVNTSPVVFDLMAQSGKDLSRYLAASTIRTPVAALTRLLDDPLPEVHGDAQARLDELQRITGLLTRRDNVTAAEQLDKLCSYIDNTIHTYAVFSTGNVQPALDDFLAGLALDTPATFEPVNGAYPHIYFQLGRIIAAAGWDALDRMNISPSQRLIVAAVAASHAGNIHDSARSAAGRYQDLLTSDTIDQITGAALASNNLTEQGHKTRSMLLSMAALSPQLNTEQVEDIFFALGQFDQAACLLAQHHLVSDEIRQALVDELDDTSACRWHITGTPAEAHEQAVTLWGSNRATSLEWFSKNRDSLQADSLIDLAENHVDWSDPTWVRVWVTLATDTLDQRHLEQLNLTAVSYLAESMHSGVTVVHHCGPDSLEALAAKRLAGILDPILAPYPASIYLLTTLTRLPDTSAELAELVEGIHHDVRRASGPAEPIRAGTATINGT